MFHCRGEEGFGRLCHAEFISGSLTKRIAKSPRLERCLTGQEQSEILRSSSADLLQYNGLPLRMTNVFDSSNKSRHPEQSEGSLSDRIGNFPSPMEEGVGERVQLVEKINLFLKKCAFTLAEVLITLGIIGVVAAITIPGLMTKYRYHVMETKLAKFDSVINQAVRMSIAENGDFTYEPPANSATNAAYLKEWFDEYLLKYMKADYEGEVINNRYYKVNLLDGSGFVSYTPNSGTTIHFFFCINSSDKSCKPESYDGKNIFVFSYSPEDRAIFPNGSSITDLQKLKYSKVSTSRGCYDETDIHRHLCAQLIKLNGWKIPKDYPW